MEEWNQISEEEKRDLRLSIWETIESQEMPPESYLWMHPEAILNSKDKQTIYRWANENEK